MSGIATFDAESAMISLVLNVPDGDGHKAQLVVTWRKNEGEDDRPVGLFLQSDRIAEQEIEPWADNVDLNLRDVVVLRDFLDCILRNVP